MLCFTINLWKFAESTGEKPTLVLKKPDISPGYLKHWEGSAFITLEKIANYFDVPVDYFFLKDDETVFTEVQQSEMTIRDDKNGIRQIYNTARIHLDYIASVLRVYLLMMTTNICKL